MELSIFARQIKETETQRREYWANHLGVSEPEAIVGGLGPATTKFLHVVLQHAEVVAPALVQRDHVYASWPDKADADELFVELYMRELIDETEVGELVVTELGLDTGPHLGY